MVSIIIVNWNSGRLLDNCVQSLIRNAAGCQIIVVDNASTDSSLTFLEGMGAEVSVLRNSRNLGFAAANNLGWRESKGTRILFLNPDAESLPGSVECLDSALSADDGVWAAGGCLLSPSGQSQPDFNVRSFPTVGKVAADMLFLDEVRRLGPRARYRRADCGAVAMDVDQPAAACLMVQRTALESAGGFDESFRPAWFEDVDLCKRIRNQGGRIRYEPGARFIHHGGYSLSRMPRQDFLESFHANQIRYFRKHHGPRIAGRVRKIVILGLLLRSAFSIAYPLAPGSSRLSSARVFWIAARRIGKLREVAA